MMYRISASMCVLIVLITIMSSATSQASNYTIGKIMFSEETSFSPGAQSVIFAPPAINAWGDVSFKVQANFEFQPFPESAIYRWQGSTLSQIAANTQFDAGSEFKDVSIPDIGNQGTVIFRASKDSGGSGIIQTDHPITLWADGAIIEDQTLDPSSRYRGFLSDPSINASNDYVFSAYTDPDDGTGDWYSGIYTGPDPTNDVVIENISISMDPTARPNGYWRNFGTPVISDAGHIAFRGSRNQGGTEIMWRGAAGGMHSLGVAPGSYKSLGEPAVSSATTAIFPAKKIGNYHAIIKGHATIATTLSSDPRHFDSFMTGGGAFHNGVGMNGAGEGVFWGYWVDDNTGMGESGIFLEPIQSGYPYQAIITSTGAIRVDGTWREVDSLSFCGGGVNDSGVVAFSATFEDGTSGVFAAYPYCTHPSNPILPTITYDSNLNPTLTATVDTTPGNNPTSYNATLGVGAGPALFIDPPIAVGYEYTKQEEVPNFHTVLVPDALPLGDDEFELIYDAAGGTKTVPLEAGERYDFTLDVPGGVDSFTIMGIDPAEGLDPEDPLAFVTGITFVEGGFQGEVYMKPISIIPEPTELALLVGVGLAFLVRRRW